MNLSAGNVSVQKITHPDRKWDIFPRESVDYQYQSGAFYFYWVIVHFKIKHANQINPDSVNKITHQGRKLDFLLLKSVDYQ